MADAPTFDQLTLIVVPGRRAPNFDPPNLSVSTLAPAVAAAPFTQVQWPNPRVTPLRARGWVFQGVIVDEELLPFRSEWRTPTKPAATQVFDAPNLLTTTLAAAPATMPFSQTEWPVVRRLARPTETIAQARPFYFDEGKPQKQDLWPAPAAWRRPITFDPPNLLHGTLTPAVVVMPFSQCDWPVVLKVRRPTETIAQARPSFYQEVTPFQLLDWPNPLRQWSTHVTWTQDRPFYYEDSVIVTAPTPRARITAPPSGVIVQDVV
jgi:hypothetical protein